MAERSVERGGRATSPFSRSVVRGLVVVGFAGLAWLFASSSAHAADRPVGGHDGGHGRASAPARPADAGTVPRNPAVATGFAATAATAVPVGTGGVRSIVGPAAHVVDRGVRTSTSPASAGTASALPGPEASVPVRDGATGAGAGGGLETTRAQRAADGDPSTKRRGPGAGRTRGEGLVGAVHGAAGRVVDLGAAGRVVDLGGAVVEPGHGVGPDRRTGPGNGVGPGPRAGFGRVLAGTSAAAIRAVSPLTGTLAASVTRTVQPVAGHGPVAFSGQWAGAWSTAAGRLAGFGAGFVGPTGFVSAAVGPGFVGPVQVGPALVAPVQVGPGFVWPVLVGPVAPGALDTSTAPDPSGPHADAGHRATAGAHPSAPDGRAAAGHGDGGTSPAQPPTLPQPPVPTCPVPGLSGTPGFGPGPHLHSGALAVVSGTVAAADMTCRRVPARTRSVARPLIAEVPTVSPD